MPQLFIVFPYTREHSLIHKYPVTLLDLYAPPPSPIPLAYLPPISLPRSWLFLSPNTCQVPSSPHRQLRQHKHRLTVSLQLTSKHLWVPSSCVPRLPCRPPLHSHSLHHPHNTLTLYITYNPLGKSFTCSRFVVWIMTGATRLSSAS